MNNRFDVVGIGNALVDALVRVPDDDVLAELGLTRGIMHPVDDATWRRALARVEQFGVELATGGSCANTMTTLGLMGSRVTYRGQVGGDELGELYCRQMVDACGGHNLRLAADSPTGKCLSIISSHDAERTMLTDLGCAIHLPDLGTFADDIRSSRFLHVTGYLLLDEPMASRAREAIDVAREAGVTVCVDVADPFVVGAVRERMWETVSKHTDIVFLNAEEARTLMGNDPVPAAMALGEVVRTVVLKQGVKGATIVHEGKAHAVGSHEVKAVDTTGAGDSYAAGFLQGLVMGWDIEHAADLGSRVAALTVGQVGAVVRDRAALARAIEAAR